MKKAFYTFILLTFATLAHAQDADKAPRWFFSTDVSTLFHANHVGRAVGLSTGVTLWQNRLQVGLRSYNRSGPINPHVETYTLPEGVTYKGQSTLQVRADHGAFGLLVSPQFRLGSKVTLAVPLVFGGMGGGFYLFGEDRDTPDGRRVSEWENDLFGDADSGFGTFLEAGVEARYRTTIPYVSLGAGVHYTHTLGWASTVGGDSYYRIPRASFSVFLGP